MNTIKNISSIHELAKYDSIIRNHARILIKDAELADDLVQNVYLQLHKYFTKYPMKRIDGGLVSVALRNALRNHQQYDTNRYDRGGADYEVSFPEIIDDIEDIYFEKIEDEKLYDIMEDRINGLEWYHKKILEYSQTMSLRQLSRESGISYQSLITSMVKIKKQLGINK